MMLCGALAFKGWGRVASCLHVTAFCLRLSWRGRPVRVLLLATDLRALCLRLALVTLVWA